MVTIHLNFLIDGGEEVSVVCFVSRKFSHAHLAQIKYILSEGLCIEKVLVHDKKSLCMVPDMKITLNFEVVEDCSGESVYLALRRHFNSRLIDYFNMHPEVTFSISSSCHCIMYLLHLKLQIKPCDLKAGVRLFYDLNL